MKFRGSRLAALIAPPASAEAGDAVRVATPADATGFLEMMPIPAAVLLIRDGKLELDATNKPFRAAGLGRETGDSPIVRRLGARIRAFLESSDVHQGFSWQLGEAVDCRHFHVLIARRPSMCDVQRCMISLVDQTGEFRTEHSLRREMMTDSLTGLPNRAGFGDLIENQVDDANRGDHAVLAINLDRFSRVNACMGAISGDELLISVARRLKGALRGRDVLARTGGDEFAVLLQMDEGPVDAMQVAKRIHRALINPFRLSDFEIRVDCAIGVALGSDAADDVEDMIRHAQFAVKRAKQTGRTEVYQSKVFRIARAQFGIETELRHAIENGAMTLAFQPISDLATGKIVSFEALARWRTEAGEELSPSQFIPVAEESGLIVPLGRWAMDEAARALADWDRAAGGDCGVKVAVNLSAIQLQRDQVPAMVCEALSRNGIDGSRLTLELTESAIVSDPDRITRTMRELKDLGATLAMDDFGTGYSNLAYLQRLPIDLLKIDRSFITGMLEDRDKLAIVRAILSLSIALGMQTTAEGIETNELSQTLAALGCTYGQGYTYSRPLPSEDARQFLLARNA